jgi:multimeric flavodoxin WrbA
MKILLLDGSAENDLVLKTAREIIEKTFNDSNHAVKSFTLRDAAIQNCIGCFSCWLKTPGVCILNDDGLEVLRLIVECDYLILLTRVTYGGYSWHLAKIMERLVSTLNPYLQRVRNKIVLRRRDDKRYMLIAFGAMAVSDKEQEDVFSELVQWDSTNYNGGPSINKILLDSYNEKIIREIIECSLSEAGIAK